MLTGKKFEENDLEYGRNISDFTHLKFAVMEIDNAGEQWSVQLLAVSFCYYPNVAVGSATGMVF